MQEPQAPQANEGTGREAPGSDDGPRRARDRDPRVRVGGLIGGLVVFALMLALPQPEGMSPAGWRTAAVAMLMAVWWISEALPVAATALAPIALFPLLGVAPIRAATAPYADPLIFLFMGGFMIAIALERWNLHRRIALNVLRVFGTRPAALVAGFMTATAALSMWVSNTATAVMMLPIGLSVIGLLHRGDISALPPEQDRNFGLALLLGIAYGASIGGLGTLIGTPPNALLAAYMAQTFGVTVGFGQWMLLGVPVSLVLLAFAWLVLTRLAFPLGGAAIAGADTVIARELGSLGPMSAAEKRVAAVFAATGLAWVFRPALVDAFPELPLSDTGIAVLAALALFLVPVEARKGRFLMNWTWAVRLPWGVLILFGGGLSLASAISATGLAGWIGEVLTGGQHWPPLLIIVTVTAVVVFLTEITSNTATAAVFLPVVGSFAVAIGAAPVQLAVPVALAASCAFMMPVATPPNAIVFSSGHVTIPDMAKAGLWLNLIAIVWLSAAAYALVLVVFT